MTEYYQILRGIQDKETEIGLKIIMNIAEEVKYTAAFGANNLIVRI